MKKNPLRLGAAMAALALALGLAGCSGGSTTGGSAGGSTTGGSAGGLPTLKQADTYTIGFAAQQSDQPWAIAMNDSIQAEAKARGNKLVMTVANASTAKQVADVESLIAQQVDVLIISPREEKPLAEATLKARDAGIPVFIVDRAVDKTVAVAGEDYVAYIGSDFFAEGKRAGEWLVEQLGGKGTVIEISGTTGSSAADDRATGFRAAIKGTDITIVATQDGNFVRDTGRQAMVALIQQYPDASAVFAHNDEMALGAITALQAAGMAPGKDIQVVSVDGEKDGLQAVIDGTLGATVECNPRFGPAVMDAIEAYGRGEAVPASVTNTDKFFDISNAAAEIGNAY